MENTNGLLENINANGENEVTEIEEDFDELVSRYINIFSLDKNGRYKSYEHIRNVFKQNKDKNDEESIELMSLHLFTYLASWGMLRNSFLLYKDYLFLKPIVRILCDKKYEQLFNISPYYDSKKSYNVNNLLDLIEEIKNSCNDIRYYKNGEEFIIVNTNFTDTLISKIILGTLGCIIAYDNNTKEGLRKINKCATLGKKSINQMIEFANRHKDKIEKHLQNLNDTYTSMKVIDMYLFEKGIQNN